MKFKEWLDTNKVFLLGLVQLLTVTLQQFVLENPENIDYKVLGLSLGVTVLSYLAKSWRGQGMSILGIIGIAADTVYQLQTSNSFSWERALLFFLIAIGLAAVPDPKSRGYEQTEIIKQAKKEGEEIVHAELTVKPK